jgi:glutaredoxin
MRQDLLSRLMTSLSSARALGAVLLGLVLASCKGGSPATRDAGADEALPPEITVTRERTDLVFSYSDPANGKLTTTSSIGAIPDAARERVIVTDLSLSPEERRADRYLYLVDLREQRPDGSFPVAIASRYSFNPGAGAAGAAGEGTAAGVIVYSASWCGVCKKTKALLRQLHVPFVERDIEASRSAAEELARKARAAGFEANGVPVIDVSGTLLQGLDERTLRAVLKEKGLLPS